MSLTVTIIAVTCLVSYMGLKNRKFFNQFMHYPIAEYRDREYYRWITGGFLHMDFVHLIFNMYVLYVFGEIVEQWYGSLFGKYMGRILFIALYILTIIAASLPSYSKHKTNPHYSAIGASGAVAGILFTFVLYDPWQMLYLFFAIPIPAVVFAVLYLVYSSWASKNSNDNIGHDAHFYGAVFGFFFTLLLKPSLIGRFIRELSDMPFF